MSIVRVEIVEWRGKDCTAGVGYYVRGLRSGHHGTIIQRTPARYFPYDDQDSYRLTVILQEKD